MFFNGCTKVRRCVLLPNAAIEMELEIGESNNMIFMYVHVPTIAIA